MLCELYIVTDRKIFVKSKNVKWYFRDLEMAIFFIFSAIPILKGAKSSFV